MYTGQHFKLKRNNFKERILTFEYITEYLFKNKNEHISFIFIPHKFDQYHDIQTQQKRANQSR